MAGPYKATMLYTLPDAGWSETHFIPGASLTTAQNAAQAINTAKLACCRGGITQVNCIGIRVVDVTTPRLGYIFSPTQATGTYTGEAGSTTTDPLIAALIRLISADGLTKSRVYFRGVPGNQVSSIDPLTTALFTGPFTTALTAYVNALIANANLAIRTAPRTYTLKAIASGSVATTLSIRRAGRPFGLRRGRRTLV